MDTHKMQRGARLRAWLEANGGAARCLLGAGYDPGTKEFKSRESWLSQVTKRGIGHVGAVRLEREFEAVGMLPGALTNNLDDEPPRRSDSPAAIPLMHADVFGLDELDAERVARGFVLVSAPDGVPPDVPRDAIVCVSLDDRSAQDGAVVLVQTVGGTFALGVYRAVVGGFEVDTGRVVLDAQRHGLRIAGVATEMRKMLTKVTYKTT